MTSWMCSGCRQYVEFRRDGIGRVWEVCQCGVHPLRPIADRASAARSAVRIIRKVPGNGPRKWTWPKEPRVCVVCHGGFMGRRGANAQCCSPPCRWKRRKASLRAQMTSFHQRTA